MYHAQDEVLLERPFSYSMLSVVTGQLLLLLLFFFTLTFR